MALGWTHTHTHTYQLCEPKQFQETRFGWCVPGLKMIQEQNITYEYTKG